MNRIILLVAFIFAFGAFQAEAQMVTRGTIAFVDYEQVFTNFFKTKLANAQLQEMMDTINRERAIMVLQFDNLQDELKKMRARVTEGDVNDPAKDTLRKQIDTRLAEMRRLESRIKTFNETQTKRWDEQSKRIRGNLMEEIQAKMKVFIKSKGYLAVVDSSQVNEKGVPAVLYLDEGADITKDVIAEINR
jgi:outer membrane protein